MRYHCQRALILGLWLLSGDAFRIHREEQQDRISEPPEDPQPDLLNAPLPQAIIDELSRSRFKSRLPPTLHGQVVVLMGDSNDRNAVQALCHLHNGTVSHIDPIYSDGLSPVALHMVQYMDQCSDSRPLVCNLDEYNFTAVMLWHFGAMSMKGQPYWHSWSLQDGDRGCMLPLFDNGTKLHASEELVKIWYPRVIREIALSRPTTLMAQSSLWDSVLLLEYLRPHGGVIPVDAGWSMLDGWTEMATTLVQSITDSKIPYTRLCWRTNPNCPFDHDHFIDGISKIQALEVKKMMADQRGPWADVCLVDWQAATFVEEKAKCDGLHYQTDAYVKLWDTTWEEIFKQRP